MGRGVLTGVCPAPKGATDCAYLLVLGKLAGDRMSFLSCLFCTIRCCHCAVALPPLRCCSSRCLVFLTRLHVKVTGKEAVAIWRLKVEESNSSGVAVVDIASL